jgi:tetratricopeptide (TPR) repeat protein
MLSLYGTQDEVAVLLAKAIELDPDYGMAHALMANSLVQQSLYDGDIERRERAADFARRAVQLDPEEPWGHAMLGYSLSFLRRVPEAGVHFERARQLNPNDVYIAMLQALWLSYAGRVEEAIASMREALKRDPFGHEWYWDDYAGVLVVAGKYDEAIAAFDKMTAPAPWSFLYAAIAQVNLGNVASARSLISRYQQSDAKLSPEDWIRMDPYVDERVTERLVSDLRTAL